MIDQRDMAPILEKVKKLLALSTSSNPHESALATAKAQELIAQYNLELSQVQVDNPVSSYKSQDITTGRRVWRRQLLYIIAKYNFCETINDRAKKCMVLIGERHNRELVLFLYEYVAQELERLALVAYERTYTTLPAITWRDSFYGGALDALNLRLRAQQSKFAATSQECRALVVVKSDALQQAVRQIYPNLQRGQGKRVVLCDGYYDGKQAGNSIVLHKVIER